MRYLILCAALLPSLAIAQAVQKATPKVAPHVTKPAKARCERPGARQVTSAERPGIRKLGELPPAQPIYTVVREVDGCPIPVSVGAH